MRALRILIDLLSGKVRAAMLYATTVGSLMIGIASQSIGFIVLARFLGTEQFGYLVTITAVMNIGTVWSGLGSGEAMRRRVSRDRSLYPAMLGHALILIFVTGAVLTIVLSLGMMMFVRAASNPVDNLKILLLLSSSSLVPYALVLLTEQIFLARSEYMRANIVNSGFGVARACTAVVACLGFGVHDLQTWAMWSAAANVVAALFCAFAVRSFGSPRWRVLRDELPLGASLGASSFFIVLRHNIDILATSTLLPASFVGVYGVAKRVLMATFVIGGTLDRLIYNKLAVAGKGGLAKTLPLARKYVWYAIGIGGATSVALFIAAPSLPWIFGNEFGGSTTVLRVLCWTLIPIGIQNVAFDAFGAADRHRARMVAGAAATIVGATLIVALTYGWGRFGTFVAIYATEFLMTTVLWLTLVRLSHRDEQPAETD